MPIVIMPINMYPCLRFRLKCSPPIGAWRRPRNSEPGTQRGHLGTALSLGRWMAYPKMGEAVPIGSMYAIYGNMDPINIPPMLAYIPYMDPMGYGTTLIYQHISNIGSLAKNGLQLVKHSKATGGTSFLKGWPVQVVHPQNDLSML